MKNTAMAIAITVTAILAIAIFGFSCYVDEFVTIETKVSVAVPETHVVTDWHVNEYDLKFSK